MSAAVTSISTRINRPGSSGAVVERASGSEFAEVWAALQDAPTRKTSRRHGTVINEPALVSAAAANMAAVKAQPDRLTDALLAFQRHSSVTFMSAVAASAYAADPAERGAPAARVPGGPGAA